MNDKRVRTRRIGLPMLVAIMLAGLIISGAYAGPPKDTRDFNTIGTQLADATITLDPLFAEGELVVRPVELGSAAMDDINDEFGTSVKQFLPRLGVFLLTAPLGADVEQLAEDIGALETVEYAHTNFLTIPMQGVQGSFAFSDENNVGTYPDETAEQMLGLAEAHAYTTGEGAKVAIIDGGVDNTHAALGGAVEWGWDYVDDDAFPFDEPGGDNSGHGTFIAGILHQVAPDATIRAYRVSQTDGTTDGYLVAEAIMQAVNDGCQVINLSVVVTGVHGAIAEALEYASMNNVVIVAAAGNGSSEEPLYPACDPSVIAVAAVDELGALAEFSRFGSHIDVSAPGVDIYSAYNDGTFAWWSGTSFAAPYVAGQAALLVSKRGEGYDAGWITDIIVETASSISLKNPGLDGVLGGGVINPLESMLADTADLGVVITTDYMELIYGVLDTATNGVYLWSSNWPSDIVIEHVDEPEFMTFSGMTALTPCFVHNSWDATGLQPGVYQDTVLFHIDGVWNDPITRVYTLEVVEPVDTAWTWIEYTGCEQFYYVDTNEWCCNDTFFFEVMSDNAPADFTIHQRPTAAPEYDFINLITTSGTTPGKVYFTIDNTALLDSFEPNPECPACGISVSNIFDYEVDGAVGYKPPFAGVVSMIVRPGYATNDFTLSVDPNPVSVTVAKGGDPVQACFQVNTRGLLDTTFSMIPYGEYDYITFPSMLGRTGTPTCFTVDATTLDPGDYEVFYRLTTPTNPPMSVFVKIDISVYEPTPASTDNEPEFALSCYPNPFNPTTEIQFTLPQTGFVKLSVYNVLGQEVKQLVNGELGAGEHTITWDSRASSGQQAASGVYFYRLETSDDVLTKKMMLLK